MRLPICLHRHAATASAATLNLINAVGTLCKIVKIVLKLLLKPNDFESHALLLLSPGEACVSAVCCVHVLVRGEVFIFGLKNGVFIH